MKRRPKFDPAWRAHVDGHRNGVVLTIADIRAGTVAEEDIDKLQNFCLFALALMQMEGPQKWALGKVNAEIMSLNLENQ